MNNILLFIFRFLPMVLCLGLLCSSAPTMLQIVMVAAVSSAMWTVADQVVKK